MDYTSLLAKVRNYDYIKHFRLHKKSLCLGKSISSDGKIKVSSKNRFANSLTKGFELAQFPKFQSPRLVLGHIESIFG